MIKRTVLPAAFALLLPLVLSPLSADAESGVSRLIRKIDDARPRGKLLRKILGKEDKEEEPKKELDEKEKESSQKIEPGKKQSPTLAKRPNSTTNLKVPDTYRKPSPTPATRRNRDDLPLASSGAASATTSAQSSRSSAAKPVSLGVSTQESSKGLRVTRIQKGSPGDKAGLKTGDYILEMAGLPVEDAEVLSGISEALNAGDQVEAKISRNGKKETVVIEFGDAPQDASSPVSASVAPGPLRNTPTPATRRDSSNATNSAYKNASANEVESLRATVNKQRQTIQQLQRQLQLMRTAR